MHDGVVIVGQTEGIHLVLGQFVEIVLLACGIKIRSNNYVQLKQIITNLEHLDQSFAYDHHFPMQTFDFVAIQIDQLESTNIPRLRASRSRVS